MKRTLRRERAQNDSRARGGRVELSVDGDLWRVPWKDFGFDYCGVYLICQRTKWPVKIGISECAAKRLDQLQTAHWNELIVGGYWICENKAAAKRLEASAHADLIEQRRHLLGEWFDMDVDRAAGIVEFAAQRIGIEAAREVPKNEKFADVWAFLDQQWAKRSRTLSVETLHMLREHEARFDELGDPIGD